MIHLHHSFPGPDTLELIESGSSPVPDPQPSLIHSLRPSHSFPSPDQSKADPEKTYSGSRGQKSKNKICHLPHYFPGPDTLNWLNPDPVRFRIRNHPSSTPSVHPILSQVRTSLKRIRIRIYDVNWGRLTPPKKVSSFVILYHTYNLHIHIYITYIHIYNFMYRVNIDKKWLAFSKIDFLFILLLTIFRWGQPSPIDIVNRNPWR